MYIIGVFRRTALWAIFLVIFGAISLRNTEILYSLIYFVGAYLFFVLIHLLACKIRKSSRTIGESYFFALGHDLVAPFSKIGMFTAVLTKKWIIRDNSKFHNFIDGLQVVTEGIWAIAIWGIDIYFILKMVLQSNNPKYWICFYRQANARKQPLICFFETTMGKIVIKRRRNIHSIALLHVETVCILSK